MTKIICLMGPTATGKSAVAMTLAERLSLEIVSVDSVMIYRGLDIGSAKPSPAERAHVPHHLVDIRDPNCPYSVSDFYRDAYRIIEDIERRGGTALLVGGTMMYFNILQRGLRQLPAADPELRRQIAAEAARSGWPVMHKKLRRQNENAAARIHPHDAQRIQRALELCALSDDDKPQAQHIAPRPQNAFLNIALIPADRKRLRQAISERFDVMLRAGLPEEVKTLLRQVPKDIDLPALRAVGYRQVAAYLRGVYDKTEMRRRAVVATCQLAKRQTTWLRSWPNLYTVDSQSARVSEQVLRIIEREFGRQRPED